MKNISRSAWTKPFERTLLTAIVATQTAATLRIITMLAATSECVRHDEQVALEFAETIAIRAKTFGKVATGDNDIKAAVLTLVGGIPRDAAELLGADVSAFRVITSLKRIHQQKMIVDALCDAGDLSTLQVLATLVGQTHLEQAAVAPVYTATIEAAKRLKALENQAVTETILRAAVSLQPNKLESLAVTFGIDIKDVENVLAQWQATASTEDGGTTVAPPTARNRENSARVA